MRILVFGASGQLGVEMAALNSIENEIIAVGSAEVDITDTDSVSRTVSEVRPDSIVNAAAYTAVDGAESDAQRARQVNTIAPGILAKTAKVAGARFVHVSTDFVFDGTSTQPISPNAETHPLGVYGKTKCEGEAMVLSACPANAVVIRTSWVYGKTGKNFVKTMLRLMSERDQLEVVSDQIGSPTWARSLAEICLAAARNPSAKGILHWSDGGKTSWHGFAVKVREIGLRLGLLDRRAEVNAIATKDYPTPARRPAYSVLDCRKTVEILGVKQTHWQENLERMMLELRG